MSSSTAHYERLPSSDHPTKPEEYDLESGPDHPLPDALDLDDEVGLGAEAEATPSNAALHAQFRHDPRFQRTPPSTWKRVALIVFLVFLVWVGWRLRVAGVREMMDREKEVETETGSVALI